MAIQEVDPRFQLGPFHIGRKPGKILPPGSIVVLRGWTNHHADYCSDVAEVLDPNRIRVCYLDGGWGGEGTIFEGVAINRKSPVRGKLRWLQSI